MLHVCYSLQLKYIYVRNRTVTGIKKPNRGKEKHYIKWKREFQSERAAGDKRSAPPYATLNNCKAHSAAFADTGFSENIKINSQSK